MTISWRFETVQTTESTNSDLLNRWHQHALIEPTSWRAMAQTAGRGRRGKNWVSHENQSLTFSLAYPFPASKTMMQLQGLSLACGLTVLKSILQYLQLSESTAKKLGLGLKWPNDLLLENRKLGGLLVEGGQKSPLEPIWMIIGVGINLSLPRLTTDHLDTANLSEINTALVDLNQEELWQFITLNIGNTLEKFTHHGFSAFQEEWNHWDSWYGYLLTVHQDQLTVCVGKSIGVNPSGYLLLDTPLGVKEISSGELSLSHNTP
jgi:BirA family biotin operon repressor/biotin-[acetyl-CoA-carboxylase] ligase